MSKNIAIIGASYLQMPLIQKAKAKGYRTHVFAWASGDVGEREADVFYPISIVEKEQIYETCAEIGICGICSIASDLAMNTVNYVARRLNLPSNSLVCTEKSTNKHFMRKAFEEHSDPSPRSFLVDDMEDLAKLEITFPVIVKPTDRSGSRGIYKVEKREDLKTAILSSMESGFEKKVLVEEFAQGREYSVECVSFQGKHHFLAMTLKYTTGAPNFIEKGHLEPAPVSEELLEKVKCTVFHALDSLEITTGASHTELKISEDGTIRLIEIGGRMGGDYIGSHLVEISTGIDFVGTVIDIAVGKEPDLTPKTDAKTVGVRFVFDREDLSVLDKIKKEFPDRLVFEDIWDLDMKQPVTDSSSRFGAFMFAGNSLEEIQKYLPYDNM